MSDLHFPDELLIEILTRLPVRSLLRCTAVSKLWCSFITSPAFVSAHFRRSRKDESVNSAILLRRYDNLYKIEKYAVINYADPQTFALASSSEICPSVACPIGYFRAVGCYNGVVCLADNLYNNLHTLTLWNPSIRKHKILPHPTISPAFPIRSVLGFGVSPHCGEDLNVVRVVYEHKRESSDLYLEAEIYSLSTGQWRRISTDVVNYYMIDFFWSQKFVNGAVHWIGYKFLDNMRLQCSIAVFHMGDELFTEIMLPDELARVSASKLYFVEVDESIAVAKYDRGDHGCSYELWIMKEYGVVESWSRLHSIELAGRMERIVCIRKNGEILFSTPQNELVSYCPTTQVINNFGIFGTSPSFYTGTYLESLILLQKQSYSSEGLSQEMTCMPN